MSDEERDYQFEDVLRYLSADLEWGMDPTTFYPNTRQVPTFYLMQLLDRYHYSTVAELTHAIEDIERWLAMYFGLIPPAWDKPGPATPEPEPDDDIRYVHVVPHNPQMSALAQRDGGWVCHYCHAPVSRDPNDGERLAHRDHKVPKSQGGGNGLDNLVLACAECNMRKGARYTYEEFYAMTAELRAPIR